MKPTPKKRGRGQPSKEATRQIRAYAKDVPKLATHGKTQAVAVRGLLRAVNIDGDVFIAVPKKAQQ